jgi:hypothetical protein
MGEYQMSENNFQEELQSTGDELAQQLVSLRQTPSGSLQRRVQAIPRQTAPQGRFSPRLAWIVVALVIVGLAIGSPVARAALEAAEEVIGRIHLTVTDLNPYTNQPANLVEGQVMSLEEARDKVLFDFAIPQGFTATQVTLYAFGDRPDLVEVNLCNANSLCLELLAFAHRESGSNLVGPESIETVLVNGQEAVVFHGGWNAGSGEWIEDVGQTTMIWEAGGVQYELMAATDTVTMEELIAIAESVH